MSSRRNKKASKERRSSPDESDVENAVKSPRLTIISDEEAAVQSAHSKTNVESQESKKPSSHESHGYEAILKTSHAKKDTASLLEQTQSSLVDDEDVEKSLDCFNESTRIYDERPFGIFASDRGVKPNAEIPWMSSQSSSENNLVIDEKVNDISHKEEFKSDVYPSSESTLIESINSGISKTDSTLKTTEIDLESDHCIEKDVPKRKGNVGSNIMSCPGHLKNLKSLRGIKGKKKKMVEKAKSRKAKKYKMHSKNNEHETRNDALSNKADVEKNISSEMQGAYSADDESVLGSSERQDMVYNLMGSLRTTVQYESFCMSLPRQETKEIGLRQKITQSFKLLRDVQNGGAKIVQLSPEMIKSAKQTLKDFKDILFTEKKEYGAELEDTLDWSSVKGRYDITSDDIEDQMPHSVCFVVAINEKTLISSREGQFVASVNPVNGTLVINFFCFQATLSDDEIQSIRRQKLTHDVADAIIYSVHCFEVSRQLRVDIDLRKITRWSLHADMKEEVGMFKAHLTEMPKMVQKWLHTSAEDRNRWQARENIFAEGARSESSCCVYVGGFLSEIKDLAALIVARESSLSTTMNVPDLKVVSASSSQENNTADKDENRDESSTSAYLSIHDISVRREKILDVLQDYNLITKEEAERIKIEPKDMSEGSKCDTNNLLNGLHLPACLNDYINFSCTFASELEELLSKPLQASSYGIEASDFSVESDDGAIDIDNMTAAELIRLNASDIVYFSFCYKEIVKNDHDKHCTRCHKCSTWRTWHCRNCDKCSYGQSIPMCEYCGHLSQNIFGKPVIKPMSIFRDQLTTGPVPIDDVETTWEELLSTDDIFPWKWDLTEDQDLGEDVNYSVNDAMVDELGLLNPFGFLLGQTREGVSRKHRRQKISTGARNANPMKAVSPDDVPPCVLQ
ncbi:hypothetical protein CHS0354_013777 [Potamilus streckersoni]|uniref:Uncharacterized protein n=1 Tax=Potamilus streckersoni TaxID=2493646 RepID=A0AAE0SHN1_9BIVA|nr:hypothetical protein CHS0354_013777 [Potamilus streckersoni]